MKHDWSLWAKHVGSRVRHFDSAGMPRYRRPRPRTHFKLLQISACRLRGTREPSCLRTSICGKGVDPETFVISTTSEGPSASEDLNGRMVQHSGVPSSVLITSLIGRRGVDGNGSAPIGAHPTRSIICG